MPDTYFAFLSHSDDPIAVHLPREEFVAFSSAVFANFLKGVPLPRAVEVPVAVDDGRLDDGLLAIADGVAHDPAPTELSDAHSFCLDHLVRPICVRLENGSRMVIRFCHFSHQSGRQRGYVQCACEDAHPKCFRYTMVDLYSSRRDLVCYLAAWHQGKSRSGAVSLSRAQHQDFQPSPDEINDMRAEIIEVQKSIVVDRSGQSDRPGYSQTGSTGMGFGSFCIA